MKRYTQADLHKVVFVWNNDPFCLAKSIYQVRVEGSNSGLQTALNLYTSPDGDPHQMVKNLEIGTPRECYRAGNAFVGKVVHNMRTEAVLVKLKIAVDCLEGGKKWKAKELLQECYKELATSKHLI